MEAFKWGSHFETGISEVDNQHRNLVDIINKFSSTLTKNKVDHDFISVLYSKLSQYAKVHFDDEELLMKKMNLDPRYIDHHTSLHKSFFAEVSRLMPTTDDLTTRQKQHQYLLDYLAHWLAYHILGTDQSLARQINSVKAGISPQEAFLIEENTANSSTEPLLVALTGLFTILSQQNEELLQLNQTLEEKVKQRTQELLQANKELHILSLTDVLTNLPNRRHAMLHLAALWHEAQPTGAPLGCLMVDADNFKEINDTYGHDAGDIVLQSLATELHNSVRTDDIVCRLGGDEFLIICPNTDLEGTLYLAEQICSQISKLKVRVGFGFWQGSVSIGAAVTSADTQNIDALIKAADQGVYLAKEAGRNCARSRQQSLSS